MRKIWVWLSAMVRATTPNHPITPILLTGVKDCLSISNQSMQPARSMARLATYGTVPGTAMRARAITDRVNRPAYHLRPAARLPDKKWAEPERRNPSRTPVHLPYGGLSFM